MGEISLDHEFLTIFREILTEVKQIRILLETIQPAEKKMAKIPEAARLLKLSPAFLRKLCKSALIPCAPISDTKNKQYIIDIPGAREALFAGSHLVPKPKRKPKYSVV